MVDIYDNEAWDPNHNAQQIVNEWPSDEYHPVIGFDGDAHDSLDQIIRRLYGFGVTLELDNGELVEAVLGHPVYDEGTERLLVEYVQVDDGVYPALERMHPDHLKADLKRGFVKRIQVS